MKNELSRGDEIYGNDVFQILLEYEVSRSVRYPDKLEILQIQMTPYGSDEATLHTAPKIFTAALNAHLRSVDIPSGSGRVYKILLPTTNETGLKSVCERLLSVLKNKFNTQCGNSVAFSLNIGATSHAGGESLTRELLLNNAETALTHAKSKDSNTFAVST